MVKSFKLLPFAGAPEAFLPATGRTPPWRPARKPIGSQPSAISAVSFDHRLTASGEIDRDVGGFMCRIDFSGLASPAGALALVGQADLAGLRCVTGPFAP